MTAILSLRGDITEVPVDAVVNTANSSLLGGAGPTAPSNAGAGPRSSPSAANGLYSVAASLLEVR